jgi:excisionase family DNA binding protein
MVKFTTSEDDVIIAEYGRRPVVQIAAMLGRQYNTTLAHIRVLHRRNILDIGHRYYGRRWTEEEVDYIREWWGLLPDVEIARHLGRSVDSCEHASGRKGHMTRRMAFYTAADVARLFGVDWHRVAGWIHAGHLKARKSLVMSRHPFWRVEDEDIQAFMRSHSCLYDWRKVQGHAFWRNLARAAGERDPWLTAMQAAQYLKVSADTIRRRCVSGALQAVNVPKAGKYGGWRIPRSEVLAVQARNGEWRGLGRAGENRLLKGSAVMTTHGRAYR